MGSNRADLLSPGHYEGYGMAVAEAVSRAIPVVSTPTGAIAELVGTDAGVLVPAGDVTAFAATLRTLMTDRSRLDALRTGALHARSSLGTWDAASARMEEALTRFAQPWADSPQGGWRFASRPTLPRGLPRLPAS